MENLTVQEPKQTDAPKSREHTVNCHNEWDPLEEVIVGVVDGASVPPWHVALKATMPSGTESFYRKHQGKPYPKELIDLARKELDNFVHILEAEGVKVTRPEPIDFSKPYSYPDWTTEGGLYAAMPRDVMLVFGNEIIETPVAWRSRAFEISAYRKLLKHYHHHGAKWSSAPKPMLDDALYDYDYTESREDEAMRYAITEHEPVFDAADFVRCGKDIFVMQSHVTNDFGIQWLQRHLGDEYKIHKIDSNERSPMHIDATFMPLAPGKLVVNAARLNSIPEMFKSWDVLEAPEPEMSDKYPLYMTSKWLSMNVIMLDHERVMVQEGEDATIRAFKNFGLKPIVCPFYHFNAFGGGFHCATLDVRRTGELQSYF